MKPTEALDLLNRVTSTFSGTRQDHVQIQVALQVLQDFLRLNQDDGYTGNDTDTNNSEEDEKEAETDSPSE